MKPEVINDLLGYEGLKIIQRPDMFNFSLDSTLLAYYAKLNKSTKKICDLCTGNAPVPIFLTLRTSAHIDCVEIQEEAADLACRSIKMNHLEDQITVYNRDLKDCYLELGANTYDLVTCNPPYFKMNENSNINDSIHKVIARHEYLVNFDEICLEAKRLLKTKGYFCLVHRPDRLSEIAETMTRHKLMIKEIIFVHPKKDKDANHMLVIAMKDGQVGLKVHKPIIVYNDDNSYTDEILSIFNYKKMV